MRHVWTKLYTVSRSPSTCQFKGPCLYSGDCWPPAFITICVSLGVRCSAPPPGGTYTNEDTTSNEHPPHSVLNYSAVLLLEPTQHPEIAAQTPPLLKHKLHKPLRPQELKQKIHVRVVRVAAPCTEGVAVRLCMRVFV